MPHEAQCPDYRLRLVRDFELPDSFIAKLPIFEEVLAAARAYAEDLAQEIAQLRRTHGRQDVIQQFAREEQDWRKKLLLLEDPFQRENEYRKIVILEILFDTRPFLSSSFRHYLPQRPGKLSPEP